MYESSLNGELLQLRTEVAALRLANAALEAQMSLGAAQTEAMLQSLESQSNDLRLAGQLQKNQRNFIQRVMDNSGALMIVLNSEGLIAQVNRRCHATLNLHSAEDFKGRVLDEWLPEDERLALLTQLPDLPWTVYSPLFETVRRAGHYAAEHKLECIDNRLRYYWLEASMQHNEQGKEEGAVVSAIDISALKHQQEHLRASERMLKEAQRIAQLGHWQYEINQDRWRYSEEVGRMLSLAETNDSLSFGEYLQHIAPEDRDKVNQAFQISLQQQAICEIDFRVLLSDGRQKWLRQRSENYYDSDQQAIRCLGTLQDISAQRLVDEQLKLAASVFDNSLDGIMITDVDADIIKINRALCDMLGYQPVEVIGNKPTLFGCGYHAPEFYAAMWRKVKAERRWQGEIWARRKDGKTVPLWQSISAVQNSDGEVICYIAMFHDLTEQKQNAEYIHHLAYYDALTELPNRQFFFERCEQALERAQHLQQVLALLFLDLDRFKHVNDSLGHPIGDELLRIIALRLRETLRQGDMVARLGGDEFIILLEDAGDLAAVKSVADKVLAALSMPFTLHGHRLDIGTSIGISCYPHDGEDTTTLIKHADLALYQAKEHGRGTFHFYESYLTDRANARLFLETDLRQALFNNELYLVYQPQYSLQNNRLVGAEALLRWKHGEQGFIPPDKFIPIAEESGLIASIGEWVLISACKQARAWLDAGYRLPKLAVNLSGAQMERGDMYVIVRRVLSETGLPAQYLELEITETYIMRQAQQNIRVLEHLRDLGVTLSIDDFGTGQSSLSYLKRLPVKKLKIDRSFVMDIPHDSHDVAITSAILALGHSLNLTVLAEGVETLEQVEFLRQLNCHEAQGYLFNRPLMVDDFTHILSQ
jgi:diguanylate cyclase (GGDEF)-like protein/PAS domain S-box-containing protein